MSRSKDFAEDLADVSESVNADVDAIVKLVQAREGESPQSQPKAAQPDQDMDAPAIATTRVHTATLKVQRRRQSRVRPASNPSLSEQVVLENVTTRLRRETNERLTDAALRQKLKREEPATRQDIIEVALQDWFRRHGYSSVEIDHE